MADHDSSDDERPRRPTLKIKELSDRKQLPDWEIEVQMTLDIQVYEPPAQVAVIYTSLSREFQSLFRERAQSARSQARSSSAALRRTAADDFLVYIVSSLREPNKTWKDRQRLLSLRQGSAPASDHLLRFKGALFQANGNGWPEEVKILFLINSLSQPARARLDLVSWPEDYAAFAKLIRGTDSAFLLPPAAGTAAEFARSRSTTISTPAGDPMQIDALSTHERLQLRQSGKCFKCQRVGHLARNCPTAAPRTTVQAVTTTTAPRTDNTGSHAARQHAAQSYISAFELLDELDAWETLDEMERQGYK